MTTQAAANTTITDQVRSQIERAIDRHRQGTVVDNANLIRFAATSAEALGHEWANNLIVNEFIEAFGGTPKAEANLRIEALTQALRCQNSPSGIANPGFAEEEQQWVYRYTSPSGRFIFSGTEKGGWVGINSPTHGQIILDFRPPSSEGEKWGIDIKVCAHGERKHRPQVRHIECAYQIIRGWVDRDLVNPPSGWEEFCSLRASSGWVWHADAAHRPRHVDAEYIQAAAAWITGLWDLPEGPRAPEPESDPAPRVVKRVRKVVGFLEVDADGNNNNTAAA